MSTGTTLKFKQAEIPVVTREAEPNPFDGAFPSDDKALIVEVPFAGDGPEVRKLIGQARKAAAAVERTARVKVDAGGTKAKPVTTLTCWTVPPIRRPRNGNNGASAESA